MRVLDGAAVRCRNFDHSQREIEQLPSLEVLLANLEVVEAHCDLVGNDLEQLAEAARRFAVGDVIALHCQGPVTKHTAERGNLRIHVGSVYRAVAS